MLKMFTESVPEGLENYYTPTEDGKFQLSVEGAVPVQEVETLKNKVKEFRDTNTQLLKDKQKYQDFSQLVGGDLSPEKFNEKVESLATSRANVLVESMKTNYETKLKELETNYSKTSGRLSELVLNNEVTRVAAEHGVLSSALEDVMLRAKNSFTVVDGELKFREEKLDAEGKPYTVQSWITEQKGRAPHLFAPSQGTGVARPPKGSGVRSPGQQVSGVDRIAAAFAGRSNVKQLN